MSKTLDGTNTFENVDELTFSAGSTVVHMQAIAGGEEYNFNLPLDAGSPGDVLTSTGRGIAPTQWIPSAAGGGTVTSVQVAAPAFMTSSGGPITTNGTITLGLSGIPLAVTSGGTGTTTSTGTGSNVLSNGPTLTGTTNINTLNLTTTLAVTEGGTGTTTSTGTGSLVLSTAPTITAPAINNPGLGGTVTSSGPIQISDTTVSTSTGTGALTVAGGVGIVGDLNVGGTITGTVVPGSINTGGTITTTNASQSTSTTTGAIVASAGGLGVALDANIGGRVTSKQTHQETLVVTSSGGLTVLDNTTPNRIEVQGTLTHTIRFPDATTVPLNYEIRIDNRSTQSVSLQSGTGSTIGISVVTGAVMFFISVDNSTIAGGWHTHSLSPTNVQWGSSIMTYSGDIQSTGSISAEQIIPKVIYTTSASTVLTIDSPKIMVNFFNTATITLPDATLLPVGYQFDITNEAVTGVCTIKNFPGTVIATLSTGAHVVFTVQTNSTSDGGWTNDYDSSLASLTIDGILRAVGGQILTGQMNSNNTTDSTSTTTGSIQTDGGLGVVKDIRCGGEIFVGGTSNSSDRQIQVAPLTTNAQCLIAFTGSTSFANPFWACGKNVASSGSDTFAIFSSTAGINIAKWNTSGPFSMELFSGGLSLEPGSGISFNSGVDTFTYSTGTWTPTLLGSVSYIEQLGRYVQTGAEIKISFRLQFNVLVSGPVLRITNLPFSIGITSAAFGVVGVGGIPGGPTVILIKATQLTTFGDFFRLNESAITLDNTWPTVILEGVLTFFT